jgi:hypothetical protein
MARKKNSPLQSSLFSVDGKPEYKQKNTAPRKSTPPEDTKKDKKSSPKRLKSAAAANTQKSIVKWEDPNGEKQPLHAKVIGRKTNPKKGDSWAFLGWVLEFTMFDYSTNKAYRWTWRDSEALAMLSKNKRSLFVTRMVEQRGDDWETPPSVKKVKHLFETWSKKKAHLKWSATVEDLPDIIDDFEPMSIKYWSDKYSDDPLGQVYFHEFEPETDIKMGLNLTKSFPKPKPLAINVIGCKITSRGIE